MNAGLEFQDSEWQILESLMDNARRRESSLIRDVPQLCCLQRFASNLARQRSPRRCQFVPPPCINRCRIEPLKPFIDYYSQLKLGHGTAGIHWSSMAWPVAGQRMAWMIAGQCMAWPAAGQCMAWPAAGQCMAWIASGQCMAWLAARPAPLPASPRLGCRPLTRARIYRPLG